MSIALIIVALLTIVPLLLLAVDLFSPVKPSLTSAA